MFVGEGGAQLEKLATSKLVQHQSEGGFICTFDNSFHF